MSVARSFKNNSKPSEKFSLNLIINGSKYSWSIFQPPLESSFKKKPKKIVKIKLVYTKIFVFIFIKI